MLWSILIGAIVELLVKFLTELFKSQLATGAVINSLSVDMFYAHFEERVRSRWWLGPRRFEAAERAYARMTKRLDSGAFAMWVTSTAPKPADLAALACAGLKKELT
jgi:hypothetical protein